MSKICFFSILISTVTVQLSSAYNILVFAFGVSNSHVLFDTRLANILAGDNGANNVTLLIEEYNPDTKKAKISKFVEEIRYSMIEPRKWHSMMSSGNEVYEDKDMNLTQLSQFIEMGKSGCEIMIQDQALLQKLRDRRFDVAIAHMASLCPMGLINLLNIRTYVWYSSGLLIDYLAANIGGTSPPSFVPQLMSSYTDRMTFWQRCRNFGGALLLAYFYNYRMVGPYNDIFRKHYGPQFPDLYRLAAKSSLLLVNNEELLDFPRPILHKILYIGGIGLSEPEKLDERWLNVVEDEEYRGVVVFSLGSIANTSLMPYAWKKIFIETFDKFPAYKFIWKFDGDLSMFKIPRNVIVSKWLPQVDLFGHSNVKAFITHAGFNSILEACTYGVPLITIPLFADQFSNFKRVERRGVALAVQKTELSVGKLYEALEKILTNKSYSQNAKRLSNLIRKKPGKQSELVRQWIEYVAENGGLENLEPASIDLNFAQYFSLDVLAAALLSLWIIFFILISILRISYRFLIERFIHRKID